MRFPEAFCGYGLSIEGPSVQSETGPPGFPGFSFVRNNSPPCDRKRWGGRRGCEGYGIIGFDYYYHYYYHNYYHYNYYHYYYYYYYHHYYYY